MSFVKSLVSIIVPAKKINNNIKNELIPALKKQTFKSFELIIITDKLCTGGPADKRDLGVKKAKGKIIAFIDDDAYPDKNWLKNAVFYFKNNQIAAVCGPGITPPNDSLKQKVSGLVLSLWLGAGGAGTYRCQPEKKRLVDDYPAFNLIIRKKDFLEVGGFNTHFWPGEDTQLCHALVYKLNKKIVYDPKILVYHHRREIFIPHLNQIARFGLHRGYFSRILPRTSLKIGYFFPAIFFSYLFLSLLFLFLFMLIFVWLRDRELKRIVFGSLAPIFIYLILLFSAAFKVFQKEKSLKIALLLIPSIFLTHLVYGIMFIKGLLSRKLKQ